MSVFVLKIIACITMLVDHMQYLFPQYANIYTYCIGRLSFPIFAFLIVQGYKHTKNLKKYIFRLIIFACISQIPFMLFRTLVGNWKLLNVIFTFLFGILAITAYEKINNKFLSCAIILLILSVSLFNLSDYGIHGVLVIFLLYLCESNKLLMILSSLISIIVFLIVVNMNFNNVYVYISILCQMISYLMCIFLYNGKKGKSMKYFFYAFYPVHMLLIYLISQVEIL